MSDEPELTTGIESAIDKWDDLSPHQHAYLSNLAINCHHGQASVASKRSRITTWGWRKDPVFLAAYEIARAVGVTSVEDGGISLCADPETFSPQVWGRIMEANDPRYRQKRDVQHSGELTHTVKRVLLTGIDPPSD